MPCSDTLGYGDWHYREPYELKALRKKVVFLEAMLCATTRAGVSILNNTSLNFLDAVDYKEAGVDRQDFEDWWENHRIFDENCKVVNK